MQRRERHDRGRVNSRLGVTDALPGPTLTGAALTDATQQREDDASRSGGTEFPFTTLTGSQKIPLNAAKVINPHATANPPDTALAPDCFVVPRLFDSEGRVVETATTTLQPGKTCQLVFAETTNPPEPIQGVRAEVSVPAERCSEAALGSMEIIDTASGDVRAVIALASTLRVPQTNPTDTSPGSD